MEQIDREFLSGLLPEGVTLILRESSPSTNSELRALANDGAAEYTLLVAGRQTDGHGRQGKPFFSPPDSGAYLSLLLRPAPSDDIAGLVTCAAAVAVAETCEDVFGVSAGVKWINDIIVNGRKVAGILAEAFDTDGFFVVLGVGANIVAPPDGFPEGLTIAGAVTDSPPEYARERFAAGTVTRFLSYFGGGADAIYEAYAARLEYTSYEEVTEN
ncbi:MAG: biotin--[acetyl-CoA-carboxylase] ligase [Oscillospiraceae bacterium]|nr:biotin--[acetyl-CoA-carboxylase] ligase [Oscillospiraceae bacterium]